MSATTTPAGPTASAVSSPEGGGRTRRLPSGRRLVAVAVVLVALVVLVVAGALLQGDEQSGGGRLDPDDATPEGARAVARVLADQGVEVVVARDAAALERADVDAGTTVLVSDPRLLGRSQAEALVDAGAARVLVADPYAEVPELFGAEPGRPSYDDDAVAAECDADAGADLEGLEVRIDAGVAFDGAEGCFATVDGVLLAVDDDLVLLGMSDALTNGRILDADNAAVALRLLGATDRLVWYVPDPADLEDDDGIGLDAFLPAWLVPAAWLLAAVVATLALARGRRLGPLATEPLPVEVRAIETTEGRGRLYRRRRDRVHAARVLRDSARRRIALHLALPRSAPPADVVADVVLRTGWPAHVVGPLLDPAAPVPTDDPTLMAFAQLLTDLEKEVRRS